MSTLTKIFLVLLVVFSIAFTSMSVSIVAQTANWRELALTYQDSARVADTNLRNQIAACTVETTAALDTITTQADQVSSLERELRASGDAAAKLRVDLAKIGAEKAGSDAIASGLMQQLTVAEAARAEYRTQRDGLEKSNIDLQRRNIDLDDRVNEQTARISVLLEQRRQYEQQLNILRRENESLATATRRSSSGAMMERPEGIALAGVVALDPVAAAPIRGRVLEVSDNLITLSVGSADGVRERMVFVIHRGDEYVGDVKITSVDPDQSAGRIVRSVVTPRTGDQATDALALGSPRG